MAVDVKTLTIGSHVEYKGKRGRIMYVAPSGDFMNCGIHTTGDCGLPANYHISGFEQIHPIPITPELLTELGLVKEAPNIVKRVGDYFIYFHYLHDDLWRIGMYDDTYNYGNCIVRYLHEAEAFLALHRVELIDE